MISKGIKILCQRFELNSNDLKNLSLNCVLVFRMTIEN